MKMNNVVLLFTNQPPELKTRLYIEIISNCETARSDIELLALREQPALRMS
jgi:hypothetical protein